MRLFCKSRRCLSFDRCYFLLGLTYMFFSFQGMMLYTSMYFCSGLPLKPMIKDCKKMSAVISDYGRHSFLLMNLPFQQCITNLCGYSDDNILDLNQGPLRELRRKLGWKPGGTGEFTEFSLRMQLAFYCEEFELAATLVKKLKSVGSGASSSCVPDQQRTMFYCLVEIQNVRDSKRMTLQSHRHRREANKHHAQMRKWVVDMGNVNSCHKLLILDAEMNSIGRTSGVELKLAYDNAIAAAARAGFLQDAALASHLACRALDYKDKSLYWDRAVNLYRKWGAEGVVRYLTRSRGQRLLEDLPEIIARPGFRARSRFNTAAIDFDVATSGTCTEIEMEIDNKC